MEDELQELENLCARYAHFKLHPLSVTCGAGWLSLLEAALVELEGLQKLAPGLEFSLLEATEKLGTLRLYISVPNGTRSDVEAVGALIGRAEQRSRTVCERCGAPAVVRERVGWLSTRCTPCFESRRQVGNEEE